MLPLLTDRCYISISTKGVAFLRVPVLGRRNYHKQFYPVEEQITKSANILCPLLNQVLAEHSRQKSQQLQVILSTDFVRFMVLPAQTTLLTESDQLAFASALYHEVYGQLSDAWLIESNDAVPHQPTLCAAIDQVFLDQLKTMANHYRFNLSAVVSYATWLVNQFRLERYSGYLALVEPTRLVLIHFDTALQSLVHEKWEDDWVSPLEILLTKAILRNGPSTRNLLIYAPMEAELDTTRFPQWKVALQQPVPSQLERSNHYQMLRGCI
ncbi:MAG: hypothetical protein KFB94_08355 [Methylophilaceae bacterium]|nr:MAG: hypothetical protein KFB94_08355 [Methylophilaceae bacterium]